MVRQVFALGAYVEVCRARASAEQLLRTVDVAALSRSALYVRSFLAVRRVERGCPNGAHSSEFSFTHNCLAHCSRQAALVHPSCHGCY